MWPGLWWWRLPISFGDGLDECIGLSLRAAQVAMISQLNHLSSVLNMALTVCLINLRNMLMSLHTSSDFRMLVAHTISGSKPPD